PLASRRIAASRPPAVPPILPTTPSSQRRPRSAQPRPAPRTGARSRAKRGGNGRSVWAILDSVGQATVVGRGLKRFTSNRLKRFHTGPALTPVGGRHHARDLY